MILADGARQMAIDEVLVDGVAAGEAPPTLRLYGFMPAAVSLGRHQPLTGSADPAWCRRHGVDLVRRPTGGGAVLHDEDCLTYALTVPLGAGELSSPRAVSALVGNALHQALEGLGLRARLVERGTCARPDDGVACFARASRHELLWDRRKVVGSAQLRRRRALLQHGSLYLRADPGRHGGATGHGRSLPVADLSTALGRSVGVEEAAAALTECLAAKAPSGAVPGRLGPRESARVERLRARRYLDAAWTLEGRVPLGRTA